MDNFWGFLGICFGCALMFSSIAIPTVIYHIKSYQLMVNEPTCIGKVFLSDADADEKVLLLQACPKGVFGG